MANGQHIIWLSEGVETWNARRQRDEFQPDYEGLTLERLVRQVTTETSFDGRFGIKFESERIGLSGYDLRYANFMMATLAAADFSHAILDRAIFYGANLPNTNFTWASLDSADLNRTNLVDADFSRANLDGAQLHNANLIRANLEGANLPGVQLNGANLDNAILRDANLDDAILIEAKLDGAILEGASLFRADCRNASFIRTSVRTIFRKNKLSPTDLSKTNLTQDQLESMLGDAGTIIPNGLIRPDHWGDVDAIGSTVAEATTASPSPVPYTPPVEFTTRQMQNHPQHTPRRPEVSKFWRQPGSMT